MPLCTTRGVAINYAVGGKAEKDKSIIFIHGAGGNGRRWLKQLSALKDNYGVALDLPGHALSEGNPCDQVFLYREWVKEFMQAMGITSAVIAGHSMGGAIAMDLCVTHPHLVKGLLLISTGPHFNVNNARLEALRQGKYDPQWVRDGFSSQAPEELIAAFSRERAADKPEATYADFLACSRFQAAGLEKVQVPTTVICGREDISTPPSFSEKLAEEIPGAKLLLVERAAHQILFERPEVVNGEIEGFVGEL